MSNDEDPLAALTTPVSFQRFLELMKNDSARDLVRKINRFLQELNEARQDPHRDSAAFQKFLSQMEADFRKHRLWRNQPREELDTAMEGLEKYLLTKLHSRTFARYPEDTERDHLLSTRLVALHFVRPHHLDIPDNVITNETLLLAVKELQKMNVYKAPRDKLVCILNCCRVIQNLLKTAGKAAGGADIFVPVLNYVVIRAAPEHMISNVEYIRRFRMKSRLSSHTEYYFMQLSGAAYFTETADAGSFTDGRQEFLSSFLQHGLLTWPQYEEAITQGGPPKSRAPPMPTIAGTNPAVCQSLMDTAITAGAPAGQQAGALDRSTGGGSQVAPADLESWNSVLTSINSLSDLEGEGTQLLVEVGCASKLAAKHKFLAIAPPDLMVGHVEPLLSEYKALVLTYEVLKEGIRNKDAAAVSRVITESLEGHKWKSVWPSYGHLVERHPYLCVGVYDLTVPNVTDLLNEYKELVLKYEVLELALCRREEQYWDSLADKDLASICSEARSENPKMDRLDSIASEPTDLAEQLNQLRAEVSLPATSNGDGNETVAGGKRSRGQGEMETGQSQVGRQAISGGASGSENPPQPTFSGSLMDAPVPMPEPSSADLLDLLSGIESTDVQVLPSDQAREAVPGVGREADGRLAGSAAAVAEADSAHLEQGAGCDGGGAAGESAGREGGEEMFAGLSLANSGEEHPSVNIDPGHDPVDAPVAGVANMEPQAGA